MNANDRLAHLHEDETASHRWTVLMAVLGALCALVALAVIALVLSWSHPSSDDPSASHLFLFDIAASLED